MTMYKKIMVPLDGSALAQCVLPHVEVFARMGKPVVELVMVVEPYEMPVRSGVPSDDNFIKRINDQQLIAAEDYLNEISSPLFSIGMTAKVVVLIGKVAESLVEYAASNNVDLIIMATHGRSGACRWIWGSVVDKVMRASSVPLLLVNVQPNT